MTNKTNLELTVSIYVGTYAKYNDGSIGGQWLDITDMDKDEYLQKCLEIHSDEQDPEIMIQDIDCHDIYRKFIDESGIDNEFWEIKENINNERFLDLDAYAEFIDLFADYDLSNFNEKYFCFIDDYNVNKAFGEQMANEMGDLDQIPDHLRYYFDFESYGSDLLINDYTESNGYVFRNY